MPLHGKIVVIKRSGGDGTEFPLTASCLFGRKPDCDIRIQLPQVSKEHCRIDLNENKEVILTNLSSVNPTRVNGEVLQQCERLKHGDVITVIDRSFRFEYPPAPTPKKRSSTGGKTETLKVLQDQQVGDSVPSETGEKRISEVSADPHLKDGTNNDNIQRCLEKTMELESKEEGSKTASPFNDLYQMIKKSLDVKTPRKSSASLLQTPTSRFCTPKPASVRKSDGKPVLSTEDKSTPKKEEDKVSAADEVKTEVENENNGTPESVKKQRRSMQTPSPPRPDENSSKSETSPQKRIRTPPQRFTVGEVIEQICSESPKSPMRRKSNEATPVKPTVTNEKEEKVEKVKEMSKKRKSGELDADLPKSQLKKKRVSFGGQLSPELFDKRLPPDSPLRKGAAPRRSLGVYKPKQSLLRRTSVIGLLKEFDQEQSPAKMKTPSPKKSSNAKSASPKTPTPAKKSPKSSSPSPKKVATLAKASPKSRSPSPKAAIPAKASPKSRSPSPKKAATPAKASPKSRSPSPKKAATPAKVTPKSKSPKIVTPATKTPKSKSPSANKMETPKNTVQTPTVQGRFSVSHISTPSPVAEEAVTEEGSSSNVSPKLPLRRKSIARKTPKMMKSAVKAMVRRSGISRASLKAKNSWADIVKFGQPKVQVPAPAKKTVIKKTKKAAVPKPQTPARALPGHVSTGHACSPVTIVVSRAQKQKVIQPTGAAPRLVANIAVLKKNMKMDEDLSGVSEMFKTPVNERKRRSVIDESSAMKTPVRDIETPLVEPSVLNTPEGPGEMMVSPLTVSSTVKDRQYNSEAVHRLLDGDEESSFVSASETTSDDPTEQQSTELKTTPISTPKQKPELPDCLTGVKRMMKTPRQKSEPVEDLRGRLLKTPKQKPEMADCLTGVKRVMKTPKQKAEAVEDLRGRLLKTPKQKVEQQECLTGVKRVMKTPKQKAEPIEDLRGKVLKTPKQKPEEQECLSGVKRIMQTPQQEAEPLEDIKVKLLETPKAPETGNASMETPANVQESDSVAEVTEMKTPNVKSSPQVSLTGIKRIMKTPKEMGTPVEDMVGVKRLLKTPKEKGEPVEENLGIQRLMKTPRVRGNKPVEDFEGLQGLMEEPQTDTTGQQETQEVEGDNAPDCGEEVAKELDLALEDPQDDVPAVISDSPEAETEKEGGVKEVVTESLPEEKPRDDETSDVMKMVSQGAGDETAPEEHPEVDTADENLSEEQPKLETAIDDLTEMERSATDLEPEGAAMDSLPKMEATSDVDMEKTTKDPEPEAPVVESSPEIEEATLSVTAMETTTKNPEPQTPVSETVPEVEDVTSGATEKKETPSDPESEKPVRDRRPKMVKAAEKKQEVTEQPDEPAVTAPVRGRRGKKTEASAAAPAVRQTTRGRNTRTIESFDAEPAVEKSESVPSEAAVKPKRGRNAKKASEDKAEIIQEVSTETKAVPEPECEQSPPAEIGQDASVSLAPVEKTVVKPRRGRKAKQPEQAAPEQTEEVSAQSDDIKAPESLPIVEEATADISEKEQVPTDPELEKKPVRGRRAKAVKTAKQKQETTEQPEEPAVPVVDTEKETNVSEVISEQVDLVPSQSDENKSSEAMEAVLEAPVTESSPEVEAEAPKVTEEGAAVVQKKPIRGRRGKTVESKVEEMPQDAKQPEEPIISAPVRGRRGKKTEAAAPVAVRQTTRGRNTKTKESPSEEQPEVVPEKPEEATQITEVTSEVMTKQKDALQQEKISAPPALELAVKPTRGRKNKQTPVEQPEKIETPVEQPEKNKVPNDEQLSDKAEPQNSVSAVVKPRRGRKTKADPAQQIEEAQDVTATVETKRPAPTPVRAKRGRNIEQEGEKHDGDKVSESHEPAKKVKRTRKAEPIHEEPKEEVQTVETVVPEKVETPCVEEPITGTKQAAAAPKSRKGGCKAKQDVKVETLVESTEIQEVPAVITTEKPKRGRRGKQAAEEAEVAAVVPEEKPSEEPEMEEKDNAEPEAPVLKPSRGRVQKTSMKNDISKAVPAKRGRRGAAAPVKETVSESADTVSQATGTSVEPAKRGRRTAAKPTTDDSLETSKLVTPAEESTVEDTKVSKRSVKWKPDLEVIEIPKETPVKAVRGRKSKLDRVDAENKNESKDAKKPEEKHLSDEVIEAQPAKRARRGVKVVDVTTEEAESSEVQPKTRRGRQAKK
ncbi:proliferation marker protein Ki-67 isoform X2 [Cheilinus undulatus]|uniref:proliferation marker protein Ki-67 isoform X2 n=1 Tax=Cheilinus undulatus TaxID=241271 RepID=UPI001BD2769F|nr:proliferation marker protein Ki-67 isoform X2 [Cheilinus undulatus]